MEKAWAYGTAIININTGGNYTIEDVKKMDRFELLNLIAQGIGAKKAGTKEQIPSGASKLSRIIGVPQPVIWSYVQCLYLEPETQKKIEYSSGIIFRDLSFDCLY